MEVIVREASAEMGLSVEAIREYLTQCLSFDLGPAEHQGLAEFFSRAHALGLITGRDELEGSSSCDLSTDSVE